VIFDDVMKGNFGFSLLVCLNLTVEKILQEIIEKILIGLIVF